MTTFFSTFCHSAPKQIAALASLPLIATSLIFTPAQAALPTSTTAPAEISTDLYAQASGLTGTWRATDVAVLEMLNQLYSPSGAAPERITGSVYATFSSDGILTVSYDELTMYMPASEGIPPITLRGNLDLSYEETTPGNLAVTGITHNIEAEVMGFTMPGPDVPSGTTSTGYSVSDEVLTFNDLNGDPVYFPGSWLRTY